MNQMEIDLSQYAPSIVNKTNADTILKEIKKLDPRSNKIYIDMVTIDAMTTICARIIFGNLYVDLGPKLYNENIKVLNASDAIKVVIKWGIKSAKETNNFVIPPSA